MKRLAGLLLIWCCALPAAMAQGYAGREDVRVFISDMVERHGFVRGELVSLFSKVRPQASVLRAIAAPAETAQRSWQAYRSRFVNAARIEAGRRFYEQHAEALQRAAKIYGVPEEIIVAIIGVETVYGRNMGGFRVIDALATLAFDYPPRADYFRGELENYLLHGRQESIDVLGQKGSYAGAIGIPQFMPGSYRRYAVDFDGDGHIDIWSNPVDAIGSAASYFKQHGWVAGEPVVARAEVDGPEYEKGLTVGLEPVLDAAALRGLGWRTDTPVADGTAVTAFRLEGAEGDEYWVGLPNFYVITRYNRSVMYAMAVHQLSEKLAQAKGATL